MAVSELDELSFAFLRHAAAAKTIEELDEHFVRLAKSFGFRTAVLINLSRYGDPISPRKAAGESKSEWATRYEELNYARIDPTIPVAFTSREAFTWAKAERSKSSKQIRTFFGEARELFAQDSLIVPVHGPYGEFSVVNLLSDAPLDLGEADRNLLQALSSLYASFSLNLLDAPLPELDEQAKSLTRRELQSLYWMSMGKHDPEIALILQISPLTVRDYIDGAKQKLGVQTRPELARKAMTIGLLLPDRAMMR